MEETNKPHMFEDCIHREYCLGAYVKDHWCGNHTERK
uniref:Uncharacterized protein n=1 Tax=Myoviridae sp. ct5xZ3 TaxID=2827601 RepID=A0A8S5RRM0_9CAUD|nr:MAG TPA: hypothetical protein [Myoviridae sp. ct5xZ3]